MDLLIERLGVQGLLAHQDQAWREMGGWRVIQVKGRSLSYFRGCLKSFGLVRRGSVRSVNQKWISLPRSSIGMEDGMVELY